MAKSKAKQKEEEARRAKQKDEHWLVVYNPWFSRHQRRSPKLNDGDLKDIAWWLQIIFGLGKVQTIQHKSNHKFIIAKIDIDVNVEPMLGQHDWVNFLSTGWNHNRLEHSKFFEYNFIQYGDQSDKQWEEYYPLTRPAPHDFPVSRDYPLPVHCERPHLGSGLGSSWCIPLRQQPNARANPPEPGLRPEAGPSSATSAPPAPHTSHSSHPTPGPQIPAPAPAPTAFIPYEPPAHHPSHLLAPAGLPAISIKREASPLRVPYFEEVEAEEKKVKREPYPTDISHTENEDIPSPELSKNVRPKAEDILSMELSYPDSGSEESHPGPGVNIELTNGPLQKDHDLVQLAPDGHGVSTQLVWIQNPFGVQFQSSGEPPRISAILWDWLVLIADGALELYFSRARAAGEDKDSIVARLQGSVDLNGVLGRHIWSQCLRDCPPQMKSKVTIVTLCLVDPKIVGLEQMDAPEPTEDCDKWFSIPYPPSSPLLKDEDDKKDIKVKIESRLKRQWSGKDEDVSGKRIKQEDYEHV